MKYPTTLLTHLQSLEPRIAAVMVAALRLYGLHDQSHAGVPNLFLPFQSLLDQREAPLVLLPILSRVLFQRVPLKGLFHS